MIDRAIKSDWFIYLIRTRQGSLYTGITTDVLQRLAAHNNGRGAKYLRAKGPLQMVYAAEIGDRALASKVEYRLKRISKERKERIVIEQPIKQALLHRLKITG